ncbi:MAG: D-aminoacyl-tRNA deacylase [Oceanococcus sp.]
MRAVIQRVSHGRVCISGDCVGEIQRGIVALVGIAPGDSEEKLQRLLDRLLGYRIFPDEQGRMNFNLQQISGGLLVVPNFTVMADTRKGMRPGFSTAAAPELASALFEQLRIAALARYPHCAFGQFGADMQVTLCNDGPITLTLEV